MTSVYVLIILLSIYGGEKSVAMQEFVDKQSCEHAIQVMQDAGWSGNDGWYAYCVPKSYTETN